MGPLDGDRHPPRPLVRSFPASQTLFLAVIMGNVMDNTAGDVGPSDDTSAAYITPFYSPIRLYLVSDLLDTSLVWCTAEYTSGVAVKQCCDTEPRVMFPRTLPAWVASSCPRFFTWAVPAALNQPPHPRGDRRDGDVIRYSASKSVRRLLHGWVDGFAARPIDSRSPRVSYR